MTARLLVVVAPDSHAHDTGRGHPERIGRVEAAVAGVSDAQLDEAVVWDPGRDATTDELRLVHDERYVAGLEEFARGGGGMLDADTVVAAGSFAAATRAAGCGLHAVEALTAEEADAAFVVVRPPGHHAVAARGQGFCLFNNVAITAAALAARGERVLIVDWDVHHGNGTQDVFWDDPRVLFVSTHQFPAYPGTGRSDETGGAHAPGLTVNVPVPPGATGDVALAALDDIVAPAAETFAPTWVLISAGFDAHRADPLADLAWSAGDYAQLAQRVTAFAPTAGRTIAFLEGGYDLAALRASAGATASVIAGANAVVTDSEGPTSGGPGRDAVARTRRALEERALSD
ncbi:MAG TPA: histone deacetylase [Acidimicrobiia bacterium]|jgi:acetoin utilization deacetylase AcuC-like enzyme